MDVAPEGGGVEAVEVEPAKRGVVDGEPGAGGFFAEGAGAAVGKVPVGGAGESQSLAQAESAAANLAPQVVQPRRCSRHDRRRLGEPAAPAGEGASVVGKGTVMTLEDNFEPVVAEVAEGEKVVEFGQLEGNVGRDGFGAEPLQTVEVAPFDVDFQVVGNPELRKNLVERADSDVDHLRPQTGRCRPSLRE